MATEFQYPSWTDHLRLLNKLNMSSRHAILASQDRLGKSAAIIGLSCLRNSEISAILSLEKVSRPQNEIRVHQAQFTSPYKGDQTYMTVVLLMLQSHKCILNRIKVWIHWFGFEFLGMQHRACHNSWVYSFQPCSNPSFTATHCHCAFCAYSYTFLLSKSSFCDQKFPTIWRFHCLLFSHIPLYIKQIQNFLSLWIQALQAQLEKCWLYLMIHPAKLQSDCMLTICLIVLTGYQKRDNSPLHWILWQRNSFKLISSLWL